MQVREFIEAVLAYTGAAEIDIVAHSLGVIIGRRVLKGGRVLTEFEDYQIGKPLNDRVRTFVGIAGPNYGVYECLIPYF